MKGSPEFSNLQDLQSNDQRKLLDVIDDLRAKGLGTYLDLPQLVVCGEQSSGKSSVLEAISGVPFPRKDTTCTRYATEVILRRSPVDKVCISITPSNSRNATEKEMLENFRHEITNFSQLENLFDSAKGIMLGSSQSFSKDVLRVEIWGPQQPALTIVDLPGFIQSTTKNQTIEDKEMVHGLVHGYLENTKSIILAVVSAKNEIENQGVLDEVRKFDDHGDRVLGIITKPDTITRGSNNELAYLSLARNENVSFNLGWHMIKNLDEHERVSTPQDRDTIESQFFEQSTFHTIEASRRGIISLRKRLSSLLFEKVKQNLPALRKSLETQIQACKSELEKLGPGRSTIDDQRAYLVELNTELQSLCTNALNGHYDDPFFQGEDSEHRRLCAVIAGQNLEFATDIERNGMQWKIVPDFSFSPGENIRSRSEAIKHCRNLLVKTKGPELPGLPNPLLVRELFCEYNRPWATKARDHVETSWDTARDFVYGALQYKADQRVADAYFNCTLGLRMAELLETANSSLDELIAIHKTHPFTVNSDYRTKVQIAEARRLTKQLMPSIKTYAERYRKPIEAEDLESFIRDAMIVQTEEDMDFAAAESALDFMLAYYEIALKTFVDNVPSIAINAKILLELPLLFRASNVLHMDDELLSTIASESEDLSERRTLLHNKLKTLNEGAGICRRHEIRTHSAIKKSPLPPTKSFTPGTLFGQSYQTPVSGKSEPRVVKPKDNPEDTATPFGGPNPGLQQQQTKTFSPKASAPQTLFGQPISKTTESHGPFKGYCFGDLRTGSQQQQGQTSSLFASPPTERKIIGA